MNCYGRYSAELNPIRSRNCAVPVTKPICGRKLPSPNRMSNRRFDLHKGHTRTVHRSFFPGKAAFPGKNDLEKFYYSWTVKGSTLWVRADRVLTAHYRGTPIRMCGNGGDNRCRARLAPCWFRGIYNLREARLRLNGLAISLW